MNSIPYTEMSAIQAGSARESICIEGLTEDDISDIIHSEKRYSLEEIQQIQEDEIHRSFGG